MNWLSPCTFIGTANVALHIIAIPVVIFGILFTLRTTWNLQVACVAAAPLLVRFATYDLVVSAFWLVMIVFELAAVEIWKEKIFPNFPQAQVGLAITMTGLLVQFFGHLISERRFPAFRLFEAVVTTPFLMTLIFLNWVFGYRNQDLNNIRRRAPMWNGSERVKLPGAVNLSSKLD